MWKIDGGGKLISYFLGISQVLNKEISLVTVGNKK